MRPGRSRWRRPRFWGRGLAEAEDDVVGGDGAEAAVAADAFAERKGPDAAVGGDVPAFGEVGLDVGGADGAGLEADEGAVDPGYEHAVVVGGGEMRVEGAEASGGEDGDADGVAGLGLDRVGTACQCQERHDCCMASSDVKQWLRGRGPLAI